MKKIFFNALVLLIFISCTGNNCCKKSKTQFDAQWFKGDFNEALVLAKEKRKPIFLYWGAKWCPPCNQLKQNIFLNKNFSAFFEKIIPIYLDGDSEAAQILGEKLNVASYPTILLLNENQDEIMRLTKVSGFDQFSRDLNLALSKVESPTTLVQKLLQKRGDFKDWKALALVIGQSDNLEKIFNTPAQQEFQLKRLIKKIPPQLIVEKTNLQSVYVSLIVNKFFAEKSYSKGTIAYLLQILSRPQNDVISRNFLINEPLRTLDYIKKHANLAQFESAKARWKNAAKLLRRSKFLTLSEKLALFIPIIEIEAMNSKPLPKPLITQISQEIAQVDLLSLSEFDRRSFVSSASYLLNSIGQMDKAKVLVKKKLEIDPLDSPWYYLSKLARVEEKQGAFEQALKLSEQAKNAAKGNATKIQWMANDLLLNLRINSNNKNQILNLTKNYFDALLSTSDGFFGRNANYANQVKSELLSVQPGGILEIAKSYSRKCQKTAEVQRSSCEQYFQSLRDSAPKNRIGLKN